jgi:membrane protein YdbS with pleckstrin-like domain
MENFSNTSINIATLPNFKEVELHPIEKRYAYVLWLNFLLPFLVYLGVATTMLYLLPFPKKYILLGAVLALVPFIVSGIEIFAGFPKRKFGVREQDIIYQKGFWIFKETIVPFRRIQHVEIRQNLIARFFNLYSLKLYTAGDAMGDLVISGLCKEVANKLKEKVLQEQASDETT